MKSIALGPCREYQGPRTKDGYGRAPLGPPILHRDGRKKGRKLVCVHRWVVEQVDGPLAPEVEVRHKCNNPPCFLYDHLIAGTHADNMRDGSEARSWHKLSLEQVAEIRRRVADGEAKMALAREFGVGWRTISRAVSGKRVRP